MIGATRLVESVKRAVPKARPPVVPWAREHVRLVGSAISERYDPTLTPWGVEPLERVCDGETRVVTYVKPVQAGGSSSGEVGLCYWLSWEQNGDVQYNWENDEKAEERWSKRIERILKACGPVMERAPSGRFAWLKGLVNFPHCNLTVQGVWVADNLDSDSVRFQINEEVHNWEPGRLAKAYNRTTAFWNSVIFNISNASKEGDQLHQALLGGTHQHWEVKCPGCRQRHVMRTRWDPKRPDLGGLRYDADGCRRPDGAYDYNRLAPTIRYQMPCGCEIRDDAAARRKLSLSGRYGEPTNTGAPESDRSYTLEAVAVDYIPWLKLIREKHEALRALKRGDPEPWRRYLRERECCFANPNDRPVLGRIVLSDRKKNREGLKNRLARLGALDRQQGELARGELPHWWGVIRDVDALGNSLLVYEGKMETDDEAADVMRRHEVEPRHVVADSGHDTTHVYGFCLKHGFNAIKGGTQAEYAHPDGSRRIYSPERPLHAMLNLDPTREDPLDEPMFWLYSKPGIRERLHWLRGCEELKWEVPGDVSEAYQEHLESEELQQRRHPRTNEVISEYVQVRDRNDLFVCECYLAMLMEMAGLLGAGLVPSGEEGVSAND